MEKLNKALEKIMDKDGFKCLENSDHSYCVSEDGKTLHVVDKKTGKTTDYSITGPITRDGNSIVIPTDKGPFRFTIDNKDGKATLGVDGPDGLKELLPLLKAGGPQGILTFNPTTGGVNVYNGQDIPLSPDFAKNGITYTGNDQGGRGYPGQNPFLLDTTKPSSGNSNNQLLLPSWPENPLLILIMLLAILAGVLVVRRDV